MTNSPFFILGFPRSGTTLLSSILNTHPDIIVHIEPEFFNLKRLVLKKMTEPILPKQFLEEVARLEGKGKLKPTLKRAHFNFLEQTTDPIDWKDLFLRILGSSNYFATKSIGNIRFIDDILSLFPDARFILLSRDPRASVYSNIVKHNITDLESNLGSIMNQSLKWKTWMTLGLNTKRNMHIIRYEDLVAEQGFELKRLFDFLEIPNWELCLDVEKRKELLDGLEESAQQHHKSLASPLLNKNYKYKKHLSAHHVKVIEHFAFPIAEKFNYKREEAPLSFRQKFNYRFLKLNFYNQRAMRKFHGSRGL